VGYGLDDRGSRVWFPAGTGIFLFTTASRTALGPHPASYPMSTRGYFPGGKAAGAWNWPLTSIQCRGQRMRGAIPPLPNTPSWCGAQLKHRDKFYFTTPWSFVHYLTKRHAMKTWWGSGDIAPRIFNLSTRWRWGVSFTPQPLYLRDKSPRSIRGDE
jgi:hypothetical protein